MPSLASYDFGRAVYTALEAGTELPTLPNTPEVAQALLVFHPEDNTACTDEEEQVNLLRFQHLTSDQPTQRSFLLLEALRRRRLDAVQQLHDACPQLLISLPIFIPLAPQQGGRTSLAAPDSSAIVFWTSCQQADATPAAWDFAPFRKISPLLDAAVENHALLAFVLRNHPELQRSAAAVCGPFKASYHIKNTASTDGSEQVGADYLEQEAGYSKGQGWMETKGKDTQNEFISHLPHLDPSGPVALCLQQGVPEVLEYLLYKHVWRHFLLEDVLLLPQNSQVPDLESRTAGVECWFLHCTALMGCPLLLHQVLSGAYGGLNRQRYAAPPKTMTSGSCRTVIRNFAQSGEDNPQRTSKAFRSDHLTDEGPCPFADSVDEGVESVTRAQDGRQAANQHPQQTEVLHDGNVEEALHIEEVTCQKNNHKIKSDKGREKECEAGSRRGRPNPNALLPVSLPVMDRWISRCMHVHVTPLHLACWRCDVASIRVLLQHGADVNAVADEVEEAEKSISSMHSGSALSGSGGSGPTFNNTPLSSSSNLGLALPPFDQAPFRGSSSTFGPGSNTSLESALRATPQERSRLTSLGLLALGLRSPPDFSLSLGRELGLVQATLPETSNRQVDRGSQQTHARVMEALRLLLDAGADVNASCTIFRKTFRPLELFLQPSVDLYYAPLMPRGGRDSAVQRCMDLERAGELVLSACWELLDRGAELGASFRSTVEWNLFHMDWMFLQDERLKQRFVHLAIFLGLFPPCCLTGPLICSCNASASLNPEGASGSPSSQRNASVSRSFFVGEAFPVGSFPAHPPPSAGASVPSSHLELTLLGRPHTSIDHYPAGHFPVVVDAYSGVTRGSYHGVVAEGIPSTSMSTTGGHLVDGVRTEEDVGITGTADALRQRAEESTAATFSSLQQRVLQQQLLHQQGCPMGDVPARWRYQAQLWLWAAEERQQRIMERCVIDIVRLSVTPRVLLSLLRFLAFPDLRLMAAITDSRSREWRGDTSTVEELREALWQAHTRSLKHSAKVAILIATRWRYRAVQALPIPESLKRYLVDARC